MKSNNVYGALMILGSGPDRQRTNAQAQARAKASVPVRLQPGPTVNAGRRL